MPPQVAEQGAESGRVIVNQAERSVALLTEKASGLARGVAMVERQAGTATVAVLALLFATAALAVTRVERKQAIRFLQPVLFDVAAPQDEQSVIARIPLSEQFRSFAPAGPTILSPTLTRRDELAMPSAPNGISGRGWMLLPVLVAVSSQEAIVLPSYTSKRAAGEPDDRGSLSAAALAEACRYLTVHLTLVGDKLNVV